MTHRSEIIDPMTRIENALRGTAGGHTSTWTCHLCNKSFQAGMEPWFHAEEMHQVSTVAGNRDELEAKKKRVLQRAQHWALTDNAGNESLPRATSTKESTKGVVEEDIEQHDLDRPNGQSPPLEDRSEENPEMEPEMLLQPDTTPISHEQLVVEVKGIYAGLVMVEAKCIDIDERQIAAAREKDPLKRVLWKITNGSH